MSGGERDGNLWGYNCVYHGILCRMYTIDNFVVVVVVVVVVCVCVCEREREIL